jgi:glutamyl-tRNA reductase
MNGHTSNPGREPTARDNGTILLVGVSHRTASVDLRERIDFAVRGLGDAVRALAAKVPGREGVVLSTCNRAELYVACDDAEGTRRDLVEFLHEFHALPAGTLDGAIYSHLDNKAVEHLFRVASGLDSLVVGEPQILGQVKEAYSTASAERTVGPMLNRLFHWAFAVGKRVRSATGIGDGAVSVSYAAVTLAKKIFGDLRGRSVLVVGAGEMGKLTAVHLKAQGIERVVITSRTAVRAASLAAALDASSIPFEQLRAALGHADIVVTATGASRPVISRDDVEAAVRSRRGEPLFIIDIALPRDVEEAAGDLEDIFLYNIDDLQAIVRDNLSRRDAEVTHASTLVAEEAERFTQWQRSRNAIPTVVALRQRFDAIRRSELSRLSPRLGCLPAETRDRVEEITRLIVEKLLLTPTEQLKSIADPNMVVTYSEALARLFDLDPNGKATRRGCPSPLSRTAAEHREAEASPAQQEAEGGAPAGKVG